MCNWADENGKHWAFTGSNAGSYYFNDYSQWSALDRLNWNAIEARDWQSRKEGKQAEFLLEELFPWHLVERIGVFSQAYYTQVKGILSSVGDETSVEIKRDWYY